MLPQLLQLLAQRGIVQLGRELVVINPWACGSCIHMGVHTPSRRVNCAASDAAPDVHPIWFRISTHVDSDGDK